MSVADLQSLFEAARWAPSSYNEQPWSYIVATREQPELYARVLSCLVEGNQAWAKAAPVLGLGCTNLRFKLNGKDNDAAQHDLGLASGNLCLEATARGLVVHQMIGILPDRARELFHVPEGVRPLTGLAIGYADAPDKLPDGLKQARSEPADPQAAGRVSVRRSVGHEVGPGALAATGCRAARANGDCRRRLVFADDRRRLGKVGEHQSPPTADFAILGAPPGVDLRAPDDHNRLTVRLRSARAPPISCAARLVDRQLFNLEELRHALGRP